jgi:hypothetical protein
MPPLPAIPGIELSGTIVARGRNVANRAVGEAVFVSARDLPVRAGCYAEYIAVPPLAAHKLPAGCDLEAAACLSNYQVAYHVLHTAARGVEAKTVLVHTAADAKSSRCTPLNAVSKIGLMIKSHGLRWVPRISRISPEFRVCSQCLPRALIGTVWSAGRVSLHRLPPADARVDTVFIRRRDVFSSSALKAFLVSAAGRLKTAEAA